MKFKEICITLVFTLLFFCLEAKEPKTILALGDSITQGGSSFTCYRQILVPALKQKGLSFKFIGPKKDAVSHHAGYSGKNTKYLLSIIKKVYSEYPANIVLIHAGHNNYAKDAPVSGIVSDTEKIIGIIRAQNPRVIILLAQVITSGKLPKYSYIPALNIELRKLTKRLLKKKYKIKLVALAKGFDWKVDTVKDKVHSSATGAKKMSDRWLAALISLLKKK